VVDACDAREHLFGRRRDEVLDVLRGCAGERDEDVRHRHVDLRFLLARRDEHGERTEQQRHECQSVA
jgi:hypothetical protein